MFSQGDPADAVYYIRKGKIKDVVASQKGKKAIVAIFGADDFFGEGCLIGQPLRLATASAMSESELIRVEKSKMIRLLQAEPAFSQMFTSHLLIRISRVEEDLADRLLNKSEKRLARALLHLAGGGHSDAAQATLTDISQRTLADIVGTTRPRINFFMNKFRRLGLVEYRGGVFKINSALLGGVLRD